MFKEYIQDLTRVLNEQDWAPLEAICEHLYQIWKERKTLYICGNGGSGGNAIHMANDFIYGVTGGDLPALKVHALTANSAVLTCIGNDEGYEYIFSHQLRSLAEKGDHLMVFSGSGNSPNVVKALEVASEMGLETSAILGYSGGKCKDLAKHVIHFPINDMQISEDVQQVIFHMAMKSVYAKIKASS